MSIDLSQLPETVTVAAGAQLEIALPSYGGSGNYWSARPVSGADVARVSIRSGDAASQSGPTPDGTQEPPALSLVSERAVVVGIVPGESTWQLVLGRSFGTDPPAASHVLHVVVERSSASGTG